MRRTPHRSSGGTGADVVARLLSRTNAGAYCTNVRYVQVLHTSARQIKNQRFRIAASRIPDFGRYFVDLDR